MPFSVRGSPMPAIHVASQLSVNVVSHIQPTAATAGWLDLGMALLAVNGELDQRESAAGKARQGKARQGKADIDRNTGESRPDEQ